MSAPVCLRQAFGACRPRKTITLPLNNLRPQSQSYATKSKPEIQGIPKTSSKEEQKKLLDQIPIKESPKRPSPQGSIAKSPSAAATVAGTVTSTTTPPATIDSIPETKQSPPKLLPSNVVAAYRAPLKHQAPYGVPVASLQLRSFSIRNLEFFADFALRAAYYLNLPASGPVPLPKRIERWTVPKSPFVHKKSQENFERITYKRLITVSDGEKSAVEVWLAILRKWQFYGVGMKANVWEWEGVDVASKMDAQSKELEKAVEAKLANFGWNKAVAGSRSLDEELHKQGVKHVGVPMMDVREGSRTAKAEI